MPGPFYCRFITLENIAQAVVDGGFATVEEIQRLVAQLYDFARDPRTVLSTPRIIQAWGYRADPWTADLTQPRQGDRMTLSRRDLIRGALATPGLGALRGLAVLGAGTLACPPRTTRSYGALLPLPSRNTGESLLALPEGFEYTVFGKAGEVMSDGLPTPNAHDGMAAFKVGNEVRLVRNHERRGPAGPGVAMAPDGPSYDQNAPGGTTTLLVDAESRELTRSFVSLSGTSTNCAGGPTPQGSWITCEETMVGPGGEYTMPHGYCFEVPAAADRAVTAVPLRAMGRFVHEAIAVDPATGIVYLTEDQEAAGFYRFIPAVPERLAEGGRLEMLAVRDRPRYDTRTRQRQFAELPVGWVPIPDPDPAGATLPNAVFTQGLDGGGAIFARLEGAWYGTGKIYINATSGGDLGLGQVWEYRPGPDGGSLRLLFESADRAVLQSPDNLCVSPRGRGLVLCEDGQGVQHLRGLGVDGAIFDFARNVVPGHETMEFAGATFSPDGRTLFVNIQTPGLTFAIWGDWDRGAL